jgi:phosphopantetheine--protein transferase-like protein
VLCNLLGKLVMEQALLEYLERLLGERVDAGDTISVSSTQRARIVGWLRDNGVPADVTRLNSNRITVSQLLTGEAFTAGAVEDKTISQSRANSSVEGNRSASSARGGPIGLGIDIQASSSMPESNDFRSDSFFKDNFSPTEIAHCIEQHDPLESFAGLWAAKEAIIKAGAGTGDIKSGLRAIEITYDLGGAPTYPQCLLSISQDHGIAVAVCIRVG